MKLDSAYPGYSVLDTVDAAEFYRRLGLEVVEVEQGININLPGGGHAFVYGRPNHEPAAFTVFSVTVPNIDAAMDELVAAGIEPQRYPDAFEQDARGVHRGVDEGVGPNIAWVLDPSGNTVAIVETAKG